MNNKEKKVHINKKVYIKNKNKKSIFNQKETLTLMVICLSKPPTLLQTERQIRPRNPSEQMRHLVK